MTRFAIRRYGAQKTKPKGPSRNEPPESRSAGRGMAVPAPTPGGFSPERTAVPAIVPLTVVGRDQIHLVGP